MLYSATSLFWILIGCDHRQVSSEASPTGKQALAVEQSTLAGQRLWCLEMAMQGQLPEDLDRQVALPIWSAFLRDGRCQVVASRSEAYRLSFWLRVPVDLSAQQIAGEILASVRLPDGSGPPMLSPAGPHPRGTEKSQPILCTAINPKPAPSLLAVGSRNSPKASLPCLAGQTALEVIPSND
ncbi:MAG: hypothetical protein JRF33_08585 [Deltaproteobacteria bacterium]|nr:hypothetical protein [Deltaproteobacteria bacterium]